MASARPNTSRPQPFWCDIGVRKKPSTARGPKLASAQMHPHSTITAGVRQPIADETGCDGEDISEEPASSRRATSPPAHSASWERDLPSRLRRLQRLASPPDCRQESDQPLQLLGPGEPVPKRTFVRSASPARMAAGARGVWKIAKADIISDLLEMRIISSRAAVEPALAGCFSTPICSH